MKPTKQVPKSKSDPELSFKNGSQGPGPVWLRCGTVPLATLVVIFKDHITAT